MQRKSGGGWILDADIAGCFDNIDRDWLIRFIEHRVEDKRLVRLIRKWLNAGIIEGTDWSDNGKGTPQGAVRSPLLANVFLHYVFDLWINQWRMLHAKGDCVVARYADDFVIGFEHGADARACLKARVDSQDRPAIIAGDTYFDYNHQSGQAARPGLGILTKDNVAELIKPDPMVDTNWADRRFNRSVPEDKSDRQDQFLHSVLDFVFAVGEARNWSPESDVVVRIDGFPDSGETSDHRPVEGHFVIPDIVEAAPSTGKLLREIIERLEQIEERLEELED